MGTQSRALAGRIYKPSKGAKFRKSDSLVKFSVDINKQKFKYFDNFFYKIFLHLIP